MEKIEAIVEVLGKFGDELGNLKSLIGEIESEVKDQITKLKCEIQNYKKETGSESTTRTLLTESEKDLRVRLSQLQLKLQSLEESHKFKEASLSSSNQRPAFNTSMSNLSCRSFASMDEISSNANFRRSFSRESLSITQHVNNNVIRDETNLQVVPAEWWREKKSFEEENENINWTKEYAERDEMKLMLMIKEGWKSFKMSFDDLEEALRTWTGKMMKWTVLKKGRAKNGKLLFNIKFENEKDVQTVYGKRKSIAEEGLIYVGEALSYVERKERWKMLEMAHKLESQGKIVECDNKKICVDGTWWKFDWTNGWKKIIDPCNVF